MNSTFWYLDAPHLRGLAQETLETEYETIICPADPLHRHGGRRLSALCVEVDPSHIRDFTWTWGNDVLVTPRVLNLSNGIISPDSKLSQSRFRTLSRSELALPICSSWPSLDGVGSRRRPPVSACLMRARRAARYLQDSRTKSTDRSHGLGQEPDLLHRLAAARIFSLRATVW